MLQFMQVLIPVFFVAVAYAGGSVTALAFYQMVLLVIAAVQWLFLAILLPLIQVYVCLQLVNSLSREDFLSKAAELLETILEWSMRTLLGVVIGIHMIQGLVLPMVDSVEVGSSFAPGAVIRDPVGRKRRRSCRTGSSWVPEL